MPKQRPTPPPFKELSLGKLPFGILLLLHEPTLGTIWKNKMNWKMPQDVYIYTMEILLLKQLE